MEIERGGGVTCFCFKNKHLVSYEITTRVRSTISLFAVLYVYVYVELHSICLDHIVSGRLRKEDKYM